MIATFPLSLLEAHLLNSSKHGSYSVGEGLMGKSVCLALPPSLTGLARMLVCVSRFSSNLGSIDSCQKQMPVTIFSCMFI